jgi:hypothetical protein
MARTATTDKPAAGPVPGLRVTTKTAERVSCAGRFWAGENRVPAADFSERELQDLRGHELLQVELIEDLNAP